MRDIAARMTSFVLVPGSGQNAASWRHVAALLRSAGHTVTMPELRKQAPNYGLCDHAAEIAAAASDGAIVVAHSLSGVFLPLVAVARPCRLLVFVAAVIPEPGTSVREQFAADPTMFWPEWIASGAAFRDPAQRDELARRFLFHDCSEAALAAELATVEPLDPQRLVTERAPFALWAAPTAAIVATADRTLRPSWIERTSQRVLGSAALGIEAGHCPMQSQPHQLTAMLLQLAKAHR